MEDVAEQIAVDELLIGCDRDAGLHQSQDR